MKVRVLLVTLLITGIAPSSANAFRWLDDDTTPPVITAPDITVEATSASGAVATFAPTATDDTDPSPTIVCDASSGALFPLGVTPVTCTATDASDNQSQKSFNVTVQDTTPPTLGPMPADIDDNTTLPAGKAESFSVTATDTVDPSPDVSCDHNSGDTFPVGTTVVHCHATDNSGNPSSVGTFNVTIHLVDTTPPVLSIPTSVSVDTENPGGRTVTYSASASDNVDPSPTVNCSPASGSNFPIGTTTVTCTAQDHATPSPNQSTRSFPVTVNLVDHTPPVLSAVPASKTIEANGPGGSVSTYATPTANDALDGPIASVSCSPSSGSLFHLGANTVTCSATDAHGNTGTAFFTITVVDTTKPNLIVPSDRAIYADTPTGIDPSSHYAALFLSEASATDLVDPHPVVSNDAGDFLTVGVHVISFSARDFSGNSVSKTAVLDVRPMPPAGTPPLPTPAPRTAPAAVLNLKADAGDGRVRLSWQIPSGVDHVVVSRALTAGGDSQVVYTGSAESFTDRGVVNDLEYRYVVVSVNARGDTSAGVATVALPKRTLLKTPKDGARLRKAPRLVWVSNSEANYYNVQLFRGDRKILSTWPVKTSFQLKKSWKYEGHAYKLSPGVYRWYVWPGFGARKAVDYGEMLGFSTFQIVR